MRVCNHLIGVINFLTLLFSLPILGGGIWLNTRANNTECLKFLQWPLIVIGISIMVTSITGLTGSCYRNNFLMAIYLVVMFFIFWVLFSFIIFAYVVTEKGSGKEVQNRAYLEYYLQDYSGWLKKRVASDSYWRNIRSCVRDHSKVCGKLRTNVPETADMFYLRNLSPIQVMYIENLNKNEVHALHGMGRSMKSYCMWGRWLLSQSTACYPCQRQGSTSGCCKPPTECGYMYQNETVWSPGGVVGTNPDCTRWSNDQNLLCYECDSCKAGVLDSLKKSWRKVSLINIVVMVALIIVYPIAYGAYKNNLKIKSCEPCGQTRMTKALPE